MHLVHTYTYLDGQNCTHILEVCKVHLANHGPFCANIYIGLSFLAVTEVWSPSQFTLGANVESHMILHNWGSPINCDRSFVTDQTEEDRCSGEQQLQPELPSG